MIRDYDDEYDRDEYAAVLAMLPEPASDTRKYLGSITTSATYFLKLKQTRLRKPSTSTLSAPLNLPPRLSCAQTAHKQTKE